VGSLLSLQSGEEEDDEWNAVYTMRISMLPVSYFPVSLGEKVLFIGKAVRVL